MNFEQEYNEVISQYVHVLDRITPGQPREVRMGILDELIGEYVEQTGQTPPANLLERMTDMVLHEELSDPHPDKMTRNEYPIMSQQQYEKRTRGLTRQRNKSGVAIREVSIDQAMHVATNGRDYLPPKRSFANPYL